MAQLSYNNAKNACTCHMSLQFNCTYLPHNFFEKNIDLCFFLEIIDKLVAELQKQLAICLENINHAQKLKKQVNKKYIKSKNYAFNDKFELNSK